MGQKVTDIVHEIIQRVKQRIADAYGLPEEVADLLGLVEAEVKREYGGDRLHIHQPAADRGQKAEAMRRDYLHTDQRPEEIASRHGVSRATLYRYLKKG